MFSVVNAANTVVQANRFRFVDLFLLQSQAETNNSDPRCSQCNRFRLLPLRNTSKASVTTTIRRSFEMWFDALRSTPIRLQFYYSTALRPFDDYVTTVGLPVCGLLMLHWCLS